PGPPPPGETARGAGSGNPENPGEKAGPPGFLY
ncbi:unnamed protein product, partial [marine sediment metagenome]